jgi:glycosyltransferase involved in cell wall biosynthesis
MSGATGLRVVQLCLLRDPAERRPAELLRAWPTIALVAEAAVSAGCTVSLFVASAHRETLAREGVEYHFGPWDRHAGPEADHALAAALRRQRPDALHLHGLNFPEEALRLRRLMPDVPLLLQDHADGPPPAWRWDRWWRQRQALAGAAGLLFCAAEQARPWRRRGLIPGGLPVIELAESSTDVAPVAREAARTRLRVHGAPALLWVAHLDANKDPLTVLDGVASASAVLPDLQLWCCFRDAPLLEAVRTRIRRDPRLAARVHLVGAIPHAEIAGWLSAADLFVSGSHREGSGYALIEALACGLPPVVTSIPSHRMLTGRGAVGQVWPAGDAAALSRALVDAWPASPDERVRQRQATRAHFERHLSREALGRALAAAYAAAHAAAHTAAHASAHPPAPAAPRAAARRSP